MIEASDVLVLGGGGLQAKALIEAAARARDLSRWTALDRAWRPDRSEGLAKLGLRTATCDMLEEPDRLLELVGSSSLVINCAGPFYRTGAAALDACIECGTDYLDICDDADATLELLERDADARAAGIKALIGMGSSPGVTNLLVRVAVDALGEADEVEICWVVDVEDVGNAAVQHFWHIFSLLDDAGVRRPVAAWEDLSTREVEFPDPVGKATLLQLSHPEPITVPRFLPVRRVRNFGGIVPNDAMFVSWAIARLGGDSSESISIEGSPMPIPDLAVALYGSYRERREPTPYRGSGLIIDVRAGDRGFRFSSADSLSMEESTGTPAAAAALLMLEGCDLESGVAAPECLDPAAFFPALGRVSRSTGSLTLRSLEDGRPGERLRIRDLISRGAAA
ncbi:MAG: saccharopine dehydrogenase NADP-binding domain-containing protein [Actinobacteria bacterium]|nr:saccharopine dehydrogenase NADP-binding domain-containing protein [Actinomycetota bacterium]